VRVLGQAGSGSRHNAYRNGIRYRCQPIHQPAMPPSTLLGCAYKEWSMPDSVAQPGDDLIIGALREI
jgi:hypothetical protein